MTQKDRPATLGALKAAVARGEVARRSVKNEVRDNLIAKLRSGARLFPGVVGYDETVIPQLVNAILARHHFILLGLRGQAKTRLMRALVDLLDEVIPVVPGSEIHDDPLAPLSAHARALVATEGDDLPIEWRPREARYVEKLATPDVTIADLIGDIDPIKAAKSGLQLGSELAMHFGLVPRANRGLFAINELPDLAGKVQVGLFNILQEGDVQIKGFPVRLPLDLMMVFTANPEDYTARGKIITPLKDRIGAEIRTHYLASRAQAMEVTTQEAWVERGLKAEIPPYVREVVEEVAFQARGDRRVDRRSGVSQRLPISALETVVSNAERRALAAGEGLVVPRVTDLYAALPSITGKIELEYEGELKGADAVARELIRGAVAQVFDGYFVDADVTSHGGVVRQRRHGAAGRRTAGLGAGGRGVQGAGPGGPGQPRRPGARRPGPPGGRGGGLRPRGTLRAEAHRPHRRRRLRRHRAGPPAGGDAPVAGALARRRRGAGAGEEEAVLQLTLRTAARARG